MTKVLYFHTNDVAELKTVKLEDGSIEIGEKKFRVDYVPKIKDLKDGSVVRINLKKGLGLYEPLYILRWDCLYPAILNSRVETREVDASEFQNIKRIAEGKKPLERNFITTITFVRDVKNTPESVYKSEKLKILGGMLKLKKSVGALPLLFGLIVGTVITYMLFFLKIIKI